VGVSRGDIDKGLWGYNGSLSAIACVTFFVPSATSTCVMLPISSLLSLLFDGAIRAAAAPSGMPVGTLPFCAVAFLLICTHDKIPGFEAVPLASVATPEDHLFAARVATFTFAGDSTSASAVRFESPRVPKRRPDSTSLASTMGAAKGAQRPRQRFFGRDVETGGTPLAKREGAREALLLTPSSSKHGGNAWLLQQQTDKLEHQQQQGVNAVDLSRGLTAALSSGAQSPRHPRSGAPGNYFV
jgi:hypothetical protein